MFFVREVCMCFFYELSRIGVIKIDDVMLLMLVTVSNHQKALDFLQWKL